MAKNDGKDAKSEKNDKGDKTGNDAGGPAVPPAIIADLVKRVRVAQPDKFRLADVDPSDKLGLERDKDLLKEIVGEIARQQELLYAEGRRAVLVVLQAMDAGGKDGTIERVFSGINPQGCQVHSFKTPSAEELSHDFLWRTTVALPQRGHIGVFNRSYYEEVLVVRVHPELLDKQNIPKALITKSIWKERFEDINAFELHLARNGIVPLKFFLHISREEQSKRLLARIDDPKKQWKFNAGDIGERAKWDEYMEVYEDMVRGTATDTAPWHVVPSDKKWFTRLVVGSAIIEAIEKIDPKYPSLGEAQLRDIANIRTALANS